MNTSVCIQIPDSTVSVITYGAFAAIVSVVISVLGMVCPFLSNIGINRRLNNINGLIQAPNTNANLP